jgi:hypothetical protein
MPEKDTKGIGKSWDPQEVEEFRRLFETDNIAPVDSADFGRRLAEIIQRSTTVKPSKRQRDEN